jgi:septal ring factor EnvC (AmiA/AmiB activator)
MIALLLLLAATGGERALLEEIQSYDLQIGAIDEQVQALETRSAEARAAEATHEAEGTAAEEEVRSRRDGVRRHLAALYRLRRRGLVRVILEAESPAEVRRRIRYLLTIVRADDASTRAFTAAAEARRAAAEKVKTDRAAVEQLEADLVARRDALTAERQHRVALLHEIRSTPALATQLAEERASAAAEVTAATSAPPDAAAAKSFRELRGQLPPPVTGKVLHPFGPYSDPLTSTTVQNLGVDYAAPFGTPFRAVADGVVARAGYVRGFGQVVVLQHGAYTTLYAHANGLRVAAGQSVRAGDVLGLVGNTGLTDDADAELHFELRYNDTPQDPAEWLHR